MENNYGLRQKSTHQGLHQILRHNKHLNKQFLTDSAPHQLKHLKDRLEAYNTKSSLLTFRKKLLEDQAKNNYSMEYDKIRGMLANSVMPFRTQAQLMNRRDELKSLGAKALSIN